MSVRYVDTNDLINSYLQQCDHGEPSHIRRSIRAGFLSEPIRFTEQDCGGPPHDRITGVLEVDDARMGPGASWLIEIIGDRTEPKTRAAPVGRPPLGRSGIAISSKVLEWLSKIR